MIRIRVKPGGRDEWRSQWGEHLRARAEANPAQELYLVVDDAADADVVHLFELYGDPAEMHIVCQPAVRRGRHGQRRNFRRGVNLFRVRDATGRAWTAARATRCWSAHSQGMEPS